MANNGLPPFPKYVGNPYDDPVDPRSPDQMPKEQAVQRGEYLYSKMGLWLRKDPSYRSIIPGFNPPDDWSMPESTIELILSYFDDPIRKEWLGREFWFIQGGNLPAWPGHLDETSPINMDDIPMFFNWLFRIPAGQIPHLEESPLTFLNQELQIQAGGQRRRKRAGSRKQSRARKSRRRRSTRK
jgi:hypothetical protein